jgi:hypothetical protein
MNTHTYSHCLLLIDKVIRGKKEKIDYLKFFVREREREREKKSLYIWHINIQTSFQLIRSENNYRVEG